MSDSTWRLLQYHKYKKYIYSYMYADHGWPVIIESNIQYFPNTDKYINLYHLATSN